MSVSVKNYTAKKEEEKIADEDEESTLIGGMFCLLAAKCSSDLYQEAIITQMQ